MPAMNMPGATDKIGEQVLLRIYLLSTDLAGTIPVYEKLVRQARQRRLAGATVVRGIYGFGARGLTASSIWHLAYPVPVVAEFVDAREAIAAFLREEVEPVVRHGAITLERAAVMMYRQRMAGAACCRCNCRCNFPALSRIFSTLPESARSPHMTSDDQGILLRIFAGEADTHEGRAAVSGSGTESCGSWGWRGRPCSKGQMGFGANSVLHTTKSIELSTDLPIVMELVDVESGHPKRCCRIWMRWYI